MLMKGGLPIMLEFFGGIILSLIIGTIHIGWWVIQRCIETPAIIIIILGLLIFFNKQK